MRVLALILLLVPIFSGVACAIEPTAGTKPMSPPPKMEDVEETEEHDNHETLKDPLPPKPTIGISLVAGGEKMDAGELPPSPVPIAAPK